MYQRSFEVNFQWHRHWTARRPDFRASRTMTPLFWRVQTYLAQWQQIRETEQAPTEWHEISEADLEAIVEILHQWVVEKHDWEAEMADALCGVFLQFYGALMATEAEKKSSSRSQPSSPAAIELDTNAPSVTTVSSDEGAVRSSSPG